MTKNLKDAQDSELLRLMAANDQDAFMALYTKYFRNVYFTAKKHLPSEDIDDVCQEVFLALWDKREYLTSVVNLKWYITTMTSNRIYDKFRTASKQERSQSAFASRLEKSVDPEKELLSKEYDQLVSKAISQLPTRQKEVFLLSRQEGMTHERIAAHLNISKDAVDKSMTRAVSFLRMRLMQHLTSMAILAMMNSSL